MPKKSRKRQTNRAATRHLTIALVWYLQESYEHCRLMFRDDDELHDTYQEWHADITATEQSLIQQGYRVIRVVLDFEVFSDWCQEKGIRRMNAEARGQYAADMAAKRIGGEV